MREVKLRVPQSQSAVVCDLAAKAGIAQVSIHALRVYGLDEAVEELKIKSSTPRIKRFLSALVQAPFYDSQNYPFSTHIVQALETAETALEVTRPVYLPFSEIQQDLWQYSHITLSSVIRSTVSAGLLAYALIKDDILLAIGAMIFTPFSSLILTLAFSVAVQDRALTRQGVRALVAALGLTIGAAYAVAHVSGGPMLFDRFGSLTVNLVISGITGCMAAVADSDDIGRRQLLGLAMAYPFVKFPVWLGIALALGFPDTASTVHRLIALFGNALVMMLSAGLSYAAMAYHGEQKQARN